MLFVWLSKAMIKKYRLSRKLWVNPFFFLNKCQKCDINIYFTKIFWTCVQIEVSHVRQTDMNLQKSLRTMLGNISINKIQVSINEFYHIYIYVWKLSCPCYLSTTIEYKAVLYLWWNKKKEEEFHQWMLQVNLSK